MKRIWIALAIALWIMGLFAATSGVPAGAHVSKNTTEIGATFTDKEPEPLLGLIPIGGTDDPDVFSGELASANSRCLKNRTVAIYRSGASNSYAHTTSKDDGTWSIEKEDPPSGTYFAFVEPRKQIKRGHRHICRGARSANMTV